MLSLVGGVVWGVEASDQITPAVQLEMERVGVSRADLATVGIDTRDGAMIFVGLTLGVLSAILWLGAAALLALLRDIAVQTRSN